RAGPIKPATTNPTGGGATTDEATGAPSAGFAAGDSRQFRHKIGRFARFVPKFVRFGGSSMEAKTSRFAGNFSGWRDPDSNRGHHDFQWSHGLCGGVARGVDRPGAAGWSSSTRRLADGDVSRSGRFGDAHFMRAWRSPSWWSSSARQGPGNRTYLVHQRR